MIKVKNWDRYVVLMHDTLNSVLNVIKTTDNERVRDYMTAVSHHLCKDVFHVACVRTKSAIEKCKDIEKYDDLVLLAYVNYMELLDCLEFTED